MYEHYELIVQTVRFRRYFAEKQRRLWRLRRLTKNCWTPSKIDAKCSAKGARLPTLISLIMYR